MIHLQRVLNDFEIGSSVRKTLNGKGRFKYFDYQYPLSVRRIRNYFMDPHPLLEEVLTVQYWIWEITRIKAHEG